MKNKILLAELYPELAAQWHPTKNGDFRADMVTPGSEKIVWWLGKCGHEWEARIADRTTRHDSKCPICLNRRVLIGYNDLATTHSQLASEWHPTLNVGLTPEMVTAGSHTVVWWLGKCRHKWQGSPNYRSRKRGCPYCANKKVLVGFNDIATTHPRIAQQWHPTLNKHLSATNFTYGNNTYKAWWLGECGHEWQTAIATRVKDSGCPYCSGRKALSGFNDLATTHPKLASEWHPTKNGDLTPQQVTGGTNQKAWWIGKCGHEWDSVISTRVKREVGCPICAGKKVLAGFNDLASNHPQLASEWHPTLNGELTPEMMSAGSSKHKVWWLCAKGHEWNTVISSRTRTDGKGTGCPQCAANTFVSRGEQEIADYLTDELGLTIEQSNRSLLKGNEIDIYVPGKKLAIEYNGVYWHSSAITKTTEQHLKKYELAREAGIQLLQIWEDEWENKTELVKRLLAHKLGESREPLVGARQTHIEVISLVESRRFLDKYHLQSRSNGSHYLGLRSRGTNQLVAVMVLVKRHSQTGLTLEITRYATSCRVPGGFTKLLKHVETTLQPSRLVTFADHCISDGGLYESNGFTAEKELAPDYRYLVRNQRAHKFGYRLARFKSDPSLLWEPNLTETQLAQLNGLHRIFDAGKTRWTKTFTHKNQFAEQ